MGFGELDLKVDFAPSRTVPLHLAAMATVAQPLATPAPLTTQTSGGLDFQSHAQRLVDPSTGMTDTLRYNNQY